MWHTACSSSLPGEVVLFGGCATSVLSPEPVNSHNLKLIYLKLVILQKMCSVARYVETPFGVFIYTSENYSATQYM